MSFADTLTTFLYTLSHPSELSAPGEEKTTSASVIFILDSFDEFLSHPRQALLYNLFDIAQSRKAPIAVVCLGRQVNVIDGLEKRVKSRFGGRIMQISRPPNLEEFWKVCQAALSVTEDDCHFAKQWNKHVQVPESDLCEGADERDFGGMMQ
jgi:origin recognition complex subunit 4